MLTLDHIVVHVDSSSEIVELKSKLDSVNIPFEPDWGKKAKGFKVSNIWIGQQYFEIVDILGPDNLWQPQWSARHAKGDRGVYCLFLKTNQAIHDLYDKLSNEGIKPSKPERTRFKWMFGLLAKKLPWQFMLLPKIPGTPIELGIIQYDAGAEEKSKPYMVPNAEDRGLLGLDRAIVSSEDREVASQWLGEVSRILGQELTVAIAEKPATLQNTVMQLTPKVSPDANFSDVVISNVAIAQ